MVAGLNNVSVYIDDIFVCGRDKREHDDNLYSVLRRIQDFGFKVKFSKCKFFVDEVTQSSDVSELRSFLGAIHFYGKFVENMQRLRVPLDELLKSGVKWQW